MFTCEKEVLQIVKTAILNSFYLIVLQASSPAQKMPVSVITGGQTLS